MTLTSDWHIHSRNSCDQACITVDDLVRRAAEEGIRDFGLTDHVHTPINLPDLVSSREEYLGAVPESRFHFGVELSCVSQWELDRIAEGAYDGEAVYGIRQGGPAWAEPALGVTREDLTACGVEYVVAGTHWPLYVPFEREAIIRDYHRQNMFLAQHPLVDIVAHPWWWMGHWKDSDGRYTGEPWFDDFGCIPQTMHAEFAAALVESDTRAEANISANLLSGSYPERFKRQYAEYLAGLKLAGVQLTLGSDCHDAGYAIDFTEAARRLSAVGISDDDFWRCPPRDM
ncbi:MAG: PHP domain-containing protein [Lentisphaerae bacterium]|jgi:histidinol phosphatase-like PHP family hydrolase|nr:PHP domain-containing protein [Lentisphaerota bacterium]MBT4816222.1 PHP domain-containing protein [Lentisphaerota bacterium]MBT5610764.1 PHP domain-containing protein [Lentisphaerota bacterium]MBT7060846.1 PHP domain-containing protein [Lentisphaerota bacterium]MBT7841265.1 PHP domain-containing protein [Lentisphaerota bacterium]